MKPKQYLQPKRRFMASVRGKFLWVELPRDQLAIIGWPDMKAWARRTGEEGWFRAYPDFDIITGMLASKSFTPYGIPLVQLRRTMAGERVEISSEAWPELLRDFAPVRKFFLNLPQEVECTVSPFHQKQWHLLELAARCGVPALELMGSNSGLAFCLASAGAFSPGRLSKDFGAILRLLQKRRRDICRRLGFPDTESTVRILSKVRPEECRVDLLQILRKRLHCDWIRKSLSHLPEINRAVLAMVTSRDYKSVTSSLLTELAECDSDTPREVQPEQLLDVASRYYKELTRRGLPEQRFRNLGQLKRFAEDVERKVTARNRQAILKMEFPAPPFPGTDVIQPITTPSLLVEEAERQHHCVDYYGDSIVKGISYVYRLATPERTTIGLIKRHSVWQLGEVATVCNRDVSEGTMKIVKEWFASVTACRESGLGRE